MQWSDIFSERVNSDLKLMPLINDHCTTISAHFFAIFSVFGKDILIEAHNGVTFFLRE